MLRLAKDPLRFARLDDLSVVHDADPVSELANDAEIMCDEKDGHPAFALNASQERQYLGLNRHVQSRGWLIGNQQIGIVCQRHCDHDPLTLSAGKLMWIGGKSGLGIGETDLGQQFHDAPARFDLLDLPVNRENFTDLLLHGMKRVEGRQWLLKNDGNSVASEFLHECLARTHEFLIIQTDGTRRMMCCRIGKQLQN